MGSWTALVVDGDGQLKLSFDRGREKYNRGGTPLLLREM